VVEVFFNTVNVQVVEAERRRERSERKYRYEEPELPQHGWWL